MLDDQEPKISRLHAFWTDCVFKSEEEFVDSVPAQQTSQKVRGMRAWQETHLRKSYNSVDLHNF